MTVQIAPTTDLATCLALRRQVFILEQSVPEAEELDGLDDGAVHLLATVDSNPVGCARLLQAGTTGKIGRVCVLQAARGSGLGARLVRAGVAHFAAMGGVAQVRLGAQTHALGLYERLGFVASGPVYDDAGIPHRDMVLDLR